MFFFKHKPKATIVKREDHCISRKNIDQDALKVLYRLSSLNFTAYLVGGSVRDMLLGRKPKDFDIGTDARPGEIRKLFRNCYLVGRRFRLAHLVYGKKIFETATFRKAPDPQAVADEHGLYQTEDNNFGTPEEDALRRDFTVNGLFYDIKTFAVIDYVGGLKDLKAKKIRCIGDPNIRFREDPVRMMRAVRFAAKLDFDICSADLRAISKFAPEIANASTSRLSEEVQRLFVRGASARSISLAYELHLLDALLPSLAHWMHASKSHAAAVNDSLLALDELARNTKIDPLTALTMAALYWPQMVDTLAANGRDWTDRFERRMAAKTVLDPAITKYKFPRAVWMRAVDLMEITPRFIKPPRGKYAAETKFATHPLFPEALLLARVMQRCDASHPLALDAWATFAESLQPPASEQPCDPVAPTKHKRHRSRHHNKGKPAPAATEAPKSADAPVATDA